MQKGKRAARTTRTKATAGYTPVYANITYAGPNPDGISLQRMQTRAVFMAVCMDDPIWQGLLDSEQTRHVTLFENICLNAAIETVAGVCNPTFEQPKFLQAYSDVCYRLTSAIMRTADSKPSMLARYLGKEILATKMGKLPMEVLDPEASRDLRATLSLRLV